MIPETKPTRQELKPCPFCGKPPYRTESVNGTNMLIIGCSACRIEFKAAKIIYPGRYEWSRDVEAAWNARADQAIAEVRRLTEESVEAWTEARRAGQVVGCLPVETTSLSGLICGIGDIAGERIEKLEEDNRKLRESLEPFVSWLKGNYAHQHNGLELGIGFNALDFRAVVTLGQVRRAAEALRAEPAGEGKA